MRPTWWDFFEESILYRHGHKSSSLESSGRVSCISAISCACSFLALFYFNSPVRSLFPFFPCFTHLLVMVFLKLLGRHVVLSYFSIFKTNLILLFFWNLAFQTKRPQKQHNTILPLLLLWPTAHVSRIHCIIVDMSIVSYAVCQIFPTVLYCTLYQATSRWKL